MKISTILKIFLFFGAITMFSSSCRQEEDLISKQNYQKDFAITDFERIDLGESFIVSVQSGPFFSVRANGYKSHIDDLAVLKIGSTLVIRYTDQQERTQPTFISITMPTIVGLNLSGTCNATANGFSYVSKIELNLSGAAVGTFRSFSDQYNINLSGASTLTLSGKTETLIAKISGSSQLYAYSLEAVRADVEVAGASRMRLTAAQSLKASVSGVGVVTYRGNPTLDITMSGAGEVSKD